MDKTEGQSCCATRSPKAEDSSSSQLKTYQPLIVIFLIAVSSALALSYAGLSFMAALMGMFLINLATLKFFDVKAFAESYARYDLVAMRFPYYGLTYPFIELSLGLLYLSDLWPVLTNLVMASILIVGTAGVVNAVRSGEKIQCACTGIGFNLPIGRVTIAENIVMLFMVLLNLFHHIG